MEYLSSIYLLLYLPIYLSIHLSIHLSLLYKEYIYIHIYVCVCVYIYMCVCVCVCVCIKSAHALSSVRSPMIWHLKVGGPGKLVYFQFKSKGPRAKEAEGTNLSPNAGEDQCPSSSSQVECGFFFPLPFYSIHPSTDWMVPPTSGKPICFIQSTDANANLNQKHSHRHSQK